MITLDVDLKGLTEADVQRAIDSYIINKNAVAWRQKHEAEQRLRVKQKRVQQGLRLRVVNAVKRCGLSVVTQDSWRSGQVNVPTYPDNEGWYNLNLIPDHYNRRDTPEKEAQYNERLVRIITNLQRSNDLDFTIETTLETPTYGDDKTPRLVTKYKARLKTDPLAVEEN